MKEKILKIENLKNFDKDGDDLDSYEGFKITTDHQEILIGVSNRSSCCESWGHIASNDNFDEYIGAELLSIVRVDTALNVEEWNKEHGYGLDEGEAMFINVETSKGLIQFTVYNSQNGYYGHSAFIKSNQLSIETVL